MKVISKQPGPLKTQIKIMAAFAIFIMARPIHGLKSVFNNIDQVQKGSMEITCNVILCHVCFPCHVYLKKNSCNTTI